MTIIINDLQTNTVMDSKAMAGVRGGMGMVPKGVPLGPALSHKPKKPGYGLGHPTHVVRKSLFNKSTQLNIAIGSAGVTQVNENSVTQF